MNPIEAKHRDLTAGRVRDFAELFGGTPETVFPYHQFSSDPNERFLIDVFVYSVESPEGKVMVAVTNGMSDQRMLDRKDQEQWSRRELIQYFRECTEGHARRLWDMAWLPLFDEFLLRSHHTILWPFPAAKGTPWKNAFFLKSIINSHREFSFEVEDDQASLLWHIPISDEELDFKKEHGADALIGRMEKVNLPWIFDEKNRPSLVG